MAQRVAGSGPLPLPTRKVGSALPNRDGVGKIIKLEPLAPILINNPFEATKENRRKKFVIYSGGNNILSPSMFREHLIAAGIPHYPVEGFWEGKPEQSYVSPAFYWHHAARDGVGQPGRLFSLHTITGYFNEDAAVLLGEEWQGLGRPASILWIDKGSPWQPIRQLPEFVGFFTEVNETRAKAHPAYTYDPATGRYYGTVKPQIRKDSV